VKLRLKKEPRVPQPGLFHFWAAAKISANVSILVSTRHDPDTAVI